MNAEFEKLAHEAASSNQTFEQYLLQLTELEVAARSTNALTSRIKQAQFPVEKGLEDYDFAAMKSVNKQKGLELARGEWGRQHTNLCLLGYAMP
ncbi:ATP-binding protein [Gimesia sp.]|uniref:ATP-binding protein n=1 Tax=Gimesia sp. TaxID=2024833 RepID=UPI003A8E8726